MQQAYKPRSAAVSDQGGGGWEPHSQAWFPVTASSDPTDMRRQGLWLAYRKRVTVVNGCDTRRRHQSFQLFVDAVSRFSGLSSNITRQHLPERRWLHVTHLRSVKGRSPRDLDDLSTATGGSSDCQVHPVEEHTTPKSNLQSLQGNE